MAKSIKQQITKVLQHVEMPDWVLGYTDLLGHPEVREEVAKFMGNHLCKTPISPDRIAFSAGASAIIEVSSFVLANPNDVVVIPAPSYPMYSNDLGIKSEIERFNLQTHINIEDLKSSSLTLELLDKTRADLVSQGKCFKLLLLTSPDNPTGLKYSKSELEAFANWCIKHEIHLIVNEIYGLSTIDTTDQDIKVEYNQEDSFTSFATIMNTKKSNFLHLWYAFSKDFAMSGMRFGVVYSWNSLFLKGYETVNIPHLVSNTTQWIILELLKDQSFIEAYIVENKKAVLKSYKSTIRMLQDLQIPYHPSRGSFFVWADFSAYLGEVSDKGQQDLWLEIYKHTGVLLTPASGFGHQKKGMFRIVFTAVPFIHLETALNRLKSYLSNKK